MSSEQARDLTETISQSIATLCAETDAAKQSATYTAWLTTISRFRQYSFGNTLLIWSQAPNATKVAGFNTWKSLGRFVQKGEKGIRILAPMIRKDEAREAGEAGTSTRIAGFRCVSVFDYAQTEGEPLPDLNTNATEGGEALLPQLEQAATALNVVLIYKAIGGAAEGYSKGGVIEIEETLDTPARCGVIVHELAHELLHKTNRAETTKQQRELEAESVAYAVLTHFGLQPKSQFYLATYGITAEMLTASLQTITATAKRIIGLLTPADNNIEKEADAGPIGDATAYPLAA